MDKQFDLDAMRAQLMAMRWSEVRSIAAKSGLSASTVDKIRRNLIKEPGFLKVRALAAALTPAKPKRTKTPA